MLTLTVRHNRRELQVNVRQNGKGYTLGIRQDGVRKGATAQSWDRVVELVRQLLGETH